MERSLPAALILTLVAGGCDSCSTGPAPAVKVARVEDLGLLECTSVIQGRDGGYSAVFRDRSIWLYGDTILTQPGEDGSSWRNNSWSHTDDLDPGDGIGGFSERVDASGAPSEFFPRTQAEHQFNLAHQGDPCQEEPCGARWAVWPGALVEDVQRERMLVFYHKIYAEIGDFNFHSVGSSLAVWSRFEDAPQRPEFHPGAEHPTLLFGKDQPGFGSAALVVGDRLYAYGCNLEDFAKPCRLARVPLAQAESPDAWSFYAGSEGWVFEVSRARTLFDGNDMMSVSYLPAFGVYLALYSQPMDTQVVYRTAPAPEGPWSVSRVAFQAEPPESDNGWIYDALHHAEYTSPDGRTLLVTYSRSTGFLRSEMRMVSLTLEP